MDLLSVSSPSSSSSLPSPHFLSNTKSSHHFSTFNPQIPSTPSGRQRIFVRNALRTTAAKSLGLGLALEPQQRERTQVTFELSGGPPQTPPTAMRGAEADPMGLLLRERIVFLGSSIDDFVADAIISQLLLLDAQDHTKDIRLFINSPGGALR
ncbi:ATP-dependent Clp protease proteolytic subunit 4, chloroplastic [Morella rubra]|uniref:ATP-dependent Clp protease proteolytic subunit n=1 Tax=Morella rubra TaxID=262757 RepID=A0A6A1VU38_9ROSI|nr:ATP-dependent Clp protease proteolytic subunit 4, chloroplastic [Morella rubra]